MLSQWVALCLTSMASLQTRTALLGKFIEVARALQGTGYADIFGFMALMTGLNSIQVIVLVSAVSAHTQFCWESAYLGIKSGN